MLRSSKCFLSVFFICFCLPSSLSSMQFHQALFQWQPVEDLVSGVLSYVIEPPAKAGLFISVTAALFTASLICCKKIKNLKRAIVPEAALCVQAQQEPAELRLVENAELEALQHKRSVCSESPRSDISPCSSRASSEDFEAGAYRVGSEAFRIADLTKKDGLLHVGPSPSAKKSGSSFEGIRAPTPCTCYVHSLEQFDSKKENLFALRSASH